MENIIVFNNILEFIIFCFPSIIAILILINKNMYMQALNQLKENFTILQSQTQKNNDIILMQLKQQEEKISKLFMNKTAAEKIRETTKYAVQFCGNNVMRNILIKSTQCAVEFVDSVLDEGIYQEGDQQLIARLQVYKDNALSYLNKFVSQQNYNLWLEMQNPIIQNYKQFLKDLCQDPINDKSARFLVRTENQMQNLTRVFIRYASLIKQQEQGNVDNEDILECDENE